MDKNKLWRLIGKTNSIPTRTCRRTINSISDTTRPGKPSPGKPK